jgi:hypothetical protein
MKLILSLILLTASSLVAAECTRPEAPELPDGETSDLAAMVEGQKAVKTYVTETEAYLDCLTAEGEAAVEEAPEVSMARIADHNKAVDDMEAVANDFNEEIREYKAKAQ